MKVVSLFAGIGGFDLALTRLGHDIVYVNEWDKYAADTYQKNFGTRPDTRSITLIPTTDIPGHDLLVGGFPCQSFSIAGKRRGFEDTRGTMFFEIARILKDKRPTYLLLENVKGLLSHDNGRTFETIMRALDELGYYTQWQVLNSKNFGVPQNRERVYIIGHLRGESRPQIFPIGANINEDEGSKEREISGTLDSTYYRNHRQSGSTYINVIGDLDDEKWSKFNESSRRVYATDGIAPTIPTSAGGGHVPKVSKTVRSGGLQSPHGAKQNWDSYEVNGRIRRLTPIECERLQGFPDNWTEGVSDTQRYKQLGNAVTVNVVYEIAKKLST